MATVYGEPDYYQTKQVLITAALTETQICLVSTISSDQLKTKTPFFTIPVLETRYGCISQTQAIMRYLAEGYPISALAGRNAFESSQVDSWMEFVNQHIEVQIVALVYKENGVALANERVKKEAINQLKLPMQALERHLATRTFFVGQQLTIADVYAFCVLQEFFQSDANNSISCPNLIRWFKTCAHQPQFEPFAVHSEAIKHPLASPKEAPPQKRIRSDSAKKSITTASNESKQSLFRRNRIRIKELLGTDEGVSFIGKTVSVAGWVRTTRVQGAGSFAFVVINDGSCFGTVQVVVDSVECPDFESVVELAGVGSSLSITGLVIESPAQGQKIEIKAQNVKVLGSVVAKEYPLAKKGHSVEFLREIAHLRPRTNLIGAVTRVRNACAYAVHKFFQERGFMYIHTPIITASDCEGAGEMFAVTTILPSDPRGDLPRTATRTVDYSKDFFSQPSFLTVSGQLNVECFACALSDVYTFGPTFRAENSHTGRHLAEFWMIEPEIAFSDLEDDMNLAEDFLKFILDYVLTNCRDDLEFFNQHVEKGLLDRLNHTLNEAFARITYTEAIELLVNPKTLKKAKFEVKPQWGEDLASEHEKYLCEQIFKKPVIVTDYPKDIKAFYMKLNDDGRTVRAMDVLVSRVGEIIGGSQREDDLEKLQQRVAEMNVSSESIAWYMDLRRFGSVPHAGFGMGFERLVLFVTGVQNIRDVIPFPRWPGHCEF